MSKLTIITDSRENTPFTFEGEDVENERRGLDVGDYTLAGFENRIVIERKTLNDYLSSITHTRKAFERELRQLRAFDVPILMIETTWPELSLGMYGAREVHPSAALSSLMAFSMYYRVIPILCGDHPTGSELTERILRLYARMIERDAKKLSGKNTDAKLDTRTGRRAGIEIDV